MSASSGLGADGRRGKHHFFVDLLVGSALSRDEKRRQVPQCEFKRDLSANSYCPNQSMDHNLYMHLLHSHPPCINSTSKTCHVKTARSVSSPCSRVFSGRIIWQPLLFKRCISPGNPKAASSPPKSCDACGLSAEAFSSHEQRHNASVHRLPRQRATVSTNKSNPLA